MTQPTPDDVKAIAEALQSQHAIVCYAQCEPCQWGMCYDEPTPHPWFNAEDIEHARTTGQPEPTGNCACSCAKDGDDR